MKDSKRNFIILSLLLVALFYGSSLVMSSTVVPPSETSDAETPEKYLRSLKMQLHDAVHKKRFHEAEVIFRRTLKLDPRNRMIRRLGSVVYYHNGKLNEAENLLRNLLLRNPGDFVCRNNYAMVLLAKKNPKAFNELKKAWLDSEGTPFILNNLKYCAKVFGQKLSPDENAEEDLLLAVPPVDAIAVDEEKK